MLYGIWLSPPHGIYESRSEMQMGTVSGSSLNTAEELTVKAARAFMPARFSIDVKSNCSIRVLNFQQRYGAMCGK